MVRETREGRREFRVEACVASSVWSMEVGVVGVESCLGSVYVRAGGADAQVNEELEHPVKFWMVKWV
jgi:hypothetical protein